MFDLILISDEKKFFDDKVLEVSVITDFGPMTILPQHQPYITKIKDKVVIKAKNGECDEYAIEKGFLYTNGKTCFVIVDTNL